jgi:hypothetical protein
MTLFDLQLFCSVTEKKERLESICEDYHLKYCTVEQKRRINVSGRSRGDVQKPLKN